MTGCRSWLCVWVKRQSSQALDPVTSHCREREREREKEKKSNSLILWTTVFDV